MSNVQELFVNPVYNALNDSTLYCVPWYKVLCTKMRSVLNGGYAFTSKRASRALELGCGTGIVSLLLAARERFEHIDALEVQEIYASLAQRNVDLNAFGEQIRVIHGDARAFPAKSDTGSYDAVFTNPPYMKTNAGAVCESEGKEIARHEHFGTIADFAACAARALKWGGSFFCVYRPDRLTDLILACRESGLEPKRLCFVSAKASLAPSMVLLEARRGGNAGLFVTPPLILRENEEDSADYTELLAFGRLPEKFERKTPCQNSRK